MMIDLSFDELCMLTHALETVYREERGEGNRAPFANHDMGDEQWTTLTDLRKRFRKAMNSETREG